ncbi:MAG: hypothetical protein ACHQRO_05885 [Vicinamibacteria bacterium]|jgi:hypothetical protein
MDIHFVSTLTPEDEDRYAPMVLAAVKAILEPMPISYAVRVVTANGLAVQHTKSEHAEDAAVAASRRTGPRLVTPAANRSSA